MSQELPTWTEALTRLEPALRAVTWPRQALAAAATDPERAIARVRVAPFVHVLLTLDEGAHRSFVTQAHLRAWGHSAHEALQVALGRSPSGEGLQRHPLGWCVRGDNAVSRLILPAFLSAFRAQAGEEVVAAAPLTDLLVVAPASKAEELLRYARRAWEQGAVPVAAYLFADQGQGLQLWRPEHGGAAARAQADSLKLTAHRAYREQLDAVDGIYEHRFLPHALLRGEDGHLLTAASLTEGHGGWLPLCEVVVLHPAQGEGIWVRFSDLRRVLGEGMVQLAGVAPERVRFTEWPDAAAWAQLVAQALPERSNG